MLMSQIKHKRSKAAIAVLAAVAGTSLVTANSTPNIELSKQVFITIANVAMCIILWDIYFDEELAKKNIGAVLSEYCVITLSSIVTAYILAKGITAVMNYFVQALGPMGWGITGLLAGTLTGFLGMGWTFYCDDLYRHPKS
jgi:energy-converting hydrogenase Eha subunit A